MFAWYFRIMRVGKLSSHLFLITLIVISTASALVFYLLSKTSLVTAQTSLRDYWRTSYDILVRPPNSKSEVETTFNVVEANYLNNLGGGISFQQYESIRNMPGIEVAAPVANLGSVSFHILLDTLGHDQYAMLRPPAEPGVYALVSEIQVDEGFRNVTRETRIYAIVLPEAESKPGYYLNQRVYVGKTVSPYPPFISLSIAAIDPEQEARLLNIDQSMIEGKYLQNIKSWSSHQTVDSIIGKEMVVEGIPVLINNTPYVTFSVSRKLEKVNIPIESLSVSAIQALGEENYLDTLPSTVITLDGPYESPVLYQRLITQLKDGPEQSLFRFSGQLKSNYLTYQQESSLSESPDQLVFGTTVTHSQESEENSITPVSFSLDAVGVFNLSQIPRPENVNQVPLETYFPPTGMLKYDENKNPVTPQEVFPSIFSGSRFTSPPLLLTTLMAAREVAGDDCISSIRVRVEGVDGLTAEAQQKIESVASAIAEQTGLDVDIMVGSSPRPVLVRIPDVGYVEEQWIQKEVTTSYDEGLSKTNQFLLVMFSFISFLTILEFNWMNAHNRRREFALSKALGWRTKEVLLMEFESAAVVGFFGSVVACGISIGLAAIFHWTIDSYALFGGAILIVTLISIFGGCVPAWIAARANPVDIFRNQADQKTVRVVPSNSVFRIALNSLIRTPLLTFLILTGITLSNALLCYLLFALNNERGYLSGTLLGQFILERLEASHVMLIGVAFLLAVTAIALFIYNRVHLDYREITITKALGWKDKDVRGLYLWQSSIIGLGGGLLGLLLAILLYRIIVGDPGPISGFIPLIFLAGLVFPCLAGLLTSFVAIKQYLRHHV